MALPDLTQQKTPPKKLHLSPWSAHRFHTINVVKPTNTSTNRHTHHAIAIVCKTHPNTPKTLSQLSWSYLSTKSVDNFVEKSHFNPSKPYQSKPKPYSSHSYKADDKIIIINKINHLQNTTYPYPPIDRYRFFYHQSTKSFTTNRHFYL